MKSIQAIQIFFTTMLVCPLLSLASPSDTNSLLSKGETGRLHLRHQSPNSTQEMMQQLQRQVHGAQSSQGLKPNETQKQNLEKTESQKKRMEEIKKILDERTRAVEGGVAGGGGAEPEGDFVTLARILHRHLMQNENYSSRTLGFPLSDYENAINTTAVQCADSDLLKLMSELKKAAFFTTRPFQINIDCKNYFEQKEKGDLGPVTIFHEYMRVIGKDTNAYEASSKLMLILGDFKLVKNELLIDRGIVTCYNQFSKVPNYLGMHADIYRYSVGVEMTKCLIAQGFTRKRNAAMTSTEVMERLGNTSFKNLVEYNDGVLKLVKRP